MSDDGGPLWIVRHHSPSPIHVVRFIRLHDEEKAYNFILAGDEQGRVSMTLLNDARPRYFWHAHKQSVLGVDIVTMQDATYIVTQGRDNKLKLFVLDTNFILPSLAVLPSRIQQDLPVPATFTSIDINALNYCPFSILDAMIAVPHTLDSGYVDIIDLRSKERVVRALGQADIQSSATKVQRAQPEDDKRNGYFRVLAGYEDGYMRLWTCNSEDNDKTNESLLWASRFHSESIMSSAVHGTFAVSVAADDQVVLYDMTNGERKKQTKCKSIGNATVSVRSDGKRIAVGGWDGNVRIYDGTLQHLSTLRYHKDTVQSLSFMQSRRVSFNDNGDDDEDEEEYEGMSIAALRRVDVADILVTAGKEGRMCLWS